MKFTTETYPIKRLGTGACLDITLYTFDSEKKGPTVYLQANMHGAETQGNIVLLELMKLLKSTPFTGKIKMVPQANPIGINHKAGTFTLGRWNHTTGNNWNRNYLDTASKYKEEIIAFAKEHGAKPISKIATSFKSFLSKLYQEELEDQGYGITDDKKLNVTLQLLASDADYVLDLHTAPVGTRYIYAPEYLEERVSDLQFPHHIIIPHEFAGAMDEACFMPWYTLYKQLGLTCPFESYTLELGSEEIIDSTLGKTDLDRITHFLSCRGVLKSGVSRYKEEVQYSAPLSQMKNYYASTGGLIEYHVSAGTYIKEGEHLATIHKLYQAKDLSQAEQKITAQQEGIIIYHGTTSNISEGVELFQIMENPKRLK